MTDKALTEEILMPLRAGLKRAVDSYQRLLQEEIPPDAKGFTAYHNACKAALMHIALLMKLMVGSAPEKADNEPDWLELAKEALKPETEENNGLLFS